jgi:hypothetical protein
MTRKTTISFAPVLIDDSLSVGEIVDVVGKKMGIKVSVVV